jgi:hypothetical protein
MGGDVVGGDRIPQEQQPPAPVGPGVPGRSRFEDLRTRSVRALRGPWGLLRIAMVWSAASVAWFLLRLAWPIGPPLLGWLPIPILPLFATVATWRVAVGAGLPVPARRVWRSLTYSSLAVLLSVFTLMTST